MTGTTDLDTVYIVDRDCLARRQLSSFLGAQGFLVSEVDSGDRLAAEIDCVAPGCVLLDIAMLEPARSRFMAAPSADCPRLPVIVMSDSGNVAAAVAAMKAGAVDVITKPIDYGVLLDMIRAALGILQIHVRDHARRASASERLSALTGREAEVLRGLIAGRSNKLLAFDFGISIRTVEMHRSSMMDRLGVRTFADALQIAFDAGDGMTTPETRDAA